MPTFEMETYLAVNAKLLAQDLLNMSGVNYELGPFFKMSAPYNWYSKPIIEWPVGQNLFCSTIYVLRFIPIDRHHFKFSSIDCAGFRESSKSLMNTEWSHNRTIATANEGSIVKDIVSYKSKLGSLGNILVPVYKAIFKHRHSRLKSKYAKIS